jgi:hypothetical protein
MKNERGKKEMKERTRKAIICMGYTTCRGVDFDYLGKNC